VEERGVTGGDLEFPKMQVNFGNKFTWWEESFIKKKNDVQCRGGGKDFGAGRFAKLGDGLENWGIAGGGWGL